MQKENPKSSNDRKKVIEIKLIVTCHYHVCVFCLQGGADVWDVDLGAAGVRRWHSWIWSVHRHSGQLWEHHHGDGGSHLRPFWYVWVKYCMSESDDALIGSDWQWVMQSGPKCSPWHPPSTSPPLTLLWVDSKREWQVKKGGCILVILLTRQLTFPVISPTFC